MRARVQALLFAAELLLVATSVSIFRPVLAQEPSEPPIPAPGTGKEEPAPKAIPTRRPLIPRRTPAIPRQQGSISVKEPSEAGRGGPADSRGPEGPGGPQDPGGDRGAQRPRVVISPGEIQVGEFLRFLGDARGLPVLPTGVSSQDLQASIYVVAPIEHATEELVRAILSVNGWQIREEELADGSKYLRVSLTDAQPTRAKVPEQPRLPEPPRPPEAAEGRAGASGESPYRVFQVEGERLRPVEAKEQSPLEAQGVERDDFTTVVTELRWLDPDQTTRTLSNVLPITGREDSLRMGTVPGTRQLVLTGRAYAVDRALKILKAVDVKERPAPEVKEPEATLKIFRLRNAEPEEVAATLAAALQVGSPPGIRAARGGPGAVPRPPSVGPQMVSVYSGPDTTIIADSRTRTLIVRTTREKDLQDIQLLLETLDGPEAKLEAQPGSEPPGKVAPHSDAAPHAEAATDSKPEPSSRPEPHSK